MHQASGEFDLVICDIDGCLSCLDRYRTTKIYRMGMLRVTIGNKSIIHPALHILKIEVNACISTLWITH